MDNEVYVIQVVDKTGVSYIATVDDSLPLSKLEGRQLKGLGKFDVPHCDEYSPEDLIEEIKKSRAAKESKIGTLQNDILQLQGLENTVSKHVKPKLPPAPDDGKKG